MASLRTWVRGYAKNKAKQQPYLLLERYRTHLFPMARSSSVVPENVATELYKELELLYQEEEADSVQGAAATPSLVSTSSFEGFASKPLIPDAGLSVRIMAVRIISHQAVVTDEATVGDLIDLGAVNRQPEAPVDMEVEQVSLSFKERKAEKERRRLEKEASEKAPSHKEKRDERETANPRPAPQDRRSYGGRKRGEG